MDAHAGQKNAKKCLKTMMFTEFSRLGVAGLTPFTNQSQILHARCHGLHIRQISSALIYSVAHVFST